MNVNIYSFFKTNSTCPGIPRHSPGFPAGLCLSLHFHWLAAMTVWKILFKREEWTLQNSRLISTLLQSKKYAYAIYMIHPGSEFSCLFFWPEEYGFPSECIDNARVGKLGKIHMRHKDQRIFPSLHNTIFKLAVYFDDDRLRWISTFCSNNNW